MVDKKIEHTIENIKKWKNRKLIGFGFKDLPALINHSLKDVSSIVFIVLAMVWTIVSRFSLLWGNIFAWIENKMGAFLALFIAVLFFIVLYFMIMKAFDLITKVFELFFEEFFLTSGKIYKILLEQYTNFKPNNKEKVLIFATGLFIIILLSGPRTSRLGFNLLWFIIISIFYKVNSNFKSKNKEKVLIFITGVFIIILLSGFGASMPGFNYSIYALLCFIIFSIFYNANQRATLWQLKMNYLTLGIFVLASIIMFRSIFLVYTRTQGFQDIWRRAFEELFQVGDMPSIKNLPLLSVSITLFLGCTILIQQSKKSLYEQWNPYSIESLGISRKAMLPTLWLMTGVFYSTAVGIHRFAFMLALALFTFQMGILLYFYLISEIHMCNEVLMYFERSVHSVQSYV